MRKIRVKRDEKVEKMKWSETDELKWVNEKQTSEEEEIIRSWREWEKSSN